MVKCLAALLFLGFVSCAKDTVVADPYADWQVRNEHYIDSIADVAHANVTGDWEIYKNYKLDFVEPGVGIVSPELGVADYVYVQYIEKGSGTVPLYTDSVSVNYEGMLIDGTVFDTCLDDKIYDPITFALNDTGLREGWKLLSSIFLPVLISNFIFIRIWDMEMLIMETFRHHPF